MTAEALWLRTCAGERGGITLDCSRLGFGPPVKHKSGKEPSQESRVIVSRDCFRVTEARGLGFSFGLGLGLALSFCLSPLPCTSLLIDTKLTLELQLLRLSPRGALWGEYQ